MKYLSRNDLETIGGRVIEAYKRLPAISGQALERVDIDFLCQELLGLRIDYARLSLNGEKIGLTSSCDIGVEVFPEDPSSTEEQYYMLDGKTILIESDLMKEGANIGRRNYTVSHESCHHIFNLYLAGETVDNISKMMQAENYDIPGKTISFSKGMIMNMLSNERYCGDAILQKSVTVDCIEKKRKKNTGEAPMYYVQNNHPAIIDRVTFNKVQEELARRKTKTPGSAKSSITSTGKYSRYALTDVLICGNCGTRYRRVTWSRNGTKRIVWRCISRLDYGKKYCSDSPTIMEDKLQEAIVRAVNKFNKQDNATYKALMRATLSEALGLNGDPEEVDMLERKIEALNNKMLALVNESVSSGDGIEAHESEFMTLSQEAELLKQRIAAIQESTAKDNGEQNRLEQIQAIIAERESKCMEYDDSIVRQMVECIKVYPGGKLEIIFGGGYLVEESV